jgi:predicted unusual protein kinase regulating ubiquinone biosynthesis (AarF/ABC1/UbiB family)
MRAFSTIEGVGKGLDPDFNFMAVAQPFALQVMSENLPSSSSLIDQLGRQAAQLSTSTLGLPKRIEETIDKLDRGDIRIRVRAQDSDRLLRKISGMQLATNYTLIFCALILSATLLFVGGSSIPAAVVGAIALVPGWMLWRLLKKLDRYDRKF